MRGTARKIFKNAAKQKNKSKSTMCRKKHTKSNTNTPKAQSCRWCEMSISCVEHHWPLPRLTSLFCAPGHPNVTHWPDNQLTTASSPPAQPPTSSLLNHSAQQLSQRWADYVRHMLIRQVTMENPVYWPSDTYVDPGRQGSSQSVILLAHSVDTIELQLIFILNLCLLHVKLCLFMTSSCWPHSHLESPFKFRAE